MPYLNQGSSSASERAILCCKNRGVPKLCHGVCVPGGVSIIARRGIKCGKKYSEIMYFCKKSKYRLRKNLL